MGLGISTDTGLAALGSVEQCASINSSNIRCRANDGNGPIVWMLSMEDSSVLDAQHQ